MKKILIIIAAVLIASCSNDNLEQNNQSNLLDYLTGETVDNHVTISASSINGNIASVDINRNFKDEDVKQFFKGSGLKSKKLYTKTNEHISAKDGNINEAASIFGTRIPLYSNNKAKYSYKVPEATMYVPERISIENPEGIKNLNINKDLSIAWNPDNKNPIDKISIVIVNRGEISGRKIVNASDYYIHKIVEDTGNFKISKEDLKKFGLNVYLDIAISRGNQVTKDNVVHTAITTDLVPARTFDRDNIPGIMH